MTSKRNTMSQKNNENVSDLDDSEKNTADITLKDLLTLVETSGKNLKDRSQGRPVEFRLACNNLTQYVEGLQRNNEQLETKVTELHKTIDIQEEKNQLLHENLSRLEDALRKQEETLQQNEKAIQETIRNTVEKETERQRVQFETLLKERAAPRQDDLQEVIQEQIKTFITEEVRREIRRAIAEVFGNKQEIQATIAAAIRDIVGSTEHSLLPGTSTQEEMSYAQKLRQPQIRKTRPTLILNPKDRSIPTSEIKDCLNKISTEEMGVTTCTTSKTGHVVIQCHTTEDLQILQTKLAQTDGLAEKVNIYESKPRNLRLIIFGAPRCSLDNYRHTQDQPIDPEISDYLTTYLEPMVKKLQQTDSTPTLKLIKLMKGRNNSTNLIIDVPEEIAQELLQRGKVLLGFNNCMVRRYITLLRCFKCQRIGHTQLNCSFRLACAFCSRNHASNDCDSKDRPACVNCTNFNQQRHPREPSRNAKHFSFAKGCASYNEEFSKLLHKVPGAFPLSRSSK